MMVEFGFHNALPAEHTQWRAARGYTIYCLSGGEISWELSRHGPWAISGAELLLVPREMRHRAREHRDTRCRLFWMVFNPSVERAIENTPFNQDELDHVAHQLLAAGVRSVTASEMLLKLLDEVATAGLNLDDESLEPASMPWLRALVCQVVIEATRCLFRNPEDSRNKEYIAAAHEFMLTHIADSITVNDIAAHLGYSPSRTYQMFKNCTGLTPNDYLLRLRVRAAKKMLSETGKSVTDVAFETGFSSSQYFARVFRKYTGQSPSSFRNDG